MDLPEVESGLTLPALDFLVRNYAPEQAELPLLLMCRISMDFLQFSFSERSTEIRSQSWPSAFLLSTVFGQIKVLCLSV
jgi:hypothetical protein